MNAWSAIKSLIFVCLAGTAVVAFAHTPGHRGPAAQTGASIVIVNGRALTGPNSSAQTRGGRTLVPAGTLAAALGAAATLDAALRRVTIERQNGVITVFDAQLGQVRENGTVILSFSGAGEITFTPRIEEMMLPVEIAAALFDVSIRFDVRQNAVVVTSGHVAAAPVASKGRRGVLEVYQAGYQYDMDRYSSRPVHSFGFNAVGRVGDGRFYFTSNSSSSPLTTLSLRRATFDVERPNGQHLTAGDFTSGWALPFLTANIRGVSASAPFHGVTAGVFGGRAFSGASYLVRPGHGYGFDTSIFGAYASKSLVSRHLTVAAGGLGFSGPSREGKLATMSANYAGQHLRLQADTAVGDFEDRAARTGGLGESVDLAGTYQVTSELSLQGRVARSGINFIAPQGGVRDPVNITAAGISWSPSKWLSASVNASSARRPGETAGSDSFVTVAGTITPSVGKPRFYFSHTASDSRLVGSGAFTLITAAQDFRRWHVYMNATRVKAIGPASINGQFGASKTINDRNSIELSQGLGSRGAYNGLVDWRSTGLAGGRLSFTAGGGYSRSASSKLTTFERLTASLQLPREASMQVSYVRTNSGPTLLLSIRGTLFKKREAGIFVGAGIDQANNFSSVSGRVYQDVNDNGVYDGETDKPQANVKVRVDGNRYVETDANGVFRFDAVGAGEHKAYLDLLSVRADLTLLDGGTRELDLKGGRSATLDFRLVRTGRIAGRVFFDKNGNGKLDEDESPLADIRIVTASGRDTLTDSDGCFTIGDLAPGEHTLLIDERTLPEKTIAASRPVAVQVFAGRETGDVLLIAIPLPAEVKHFASKTQ